MGRGLILRDFKIFMVTLFVASVGLQHPALAQESEIISAVELVSDGKAQKGYDKLLSSNDQKFALDRIHSKYFILGIWARDLKLYPASIEHFNKSLKMSSLNTAYIHYLLGTVYQAQGQLTEARKYFRQALNEKPPRNISFSIGYELSQMAIAQGQHSEARNYLMNLERNWRGTPNYPDVLWRLIAVELATQRRHLACRWARKLYAKYPGSMPVKDWGFDLANNLYSARPIGCQASNKELNERIKRLQLTGFAAKAKSEIDAMRASAKGDALISADMLLVGYLENQGYPMEAMQVLLSHYKEMKTNFNYETMLGKIAARAGEYQLAIGAYFNAYRLSPQSKSGRSALFSSAFLSYQIQDYDGAFRRFSEIIRKFPGSGLARDAKWHLAWLRYLKADYSGAESAFAKLMNEKIYLRRRRTRQPYNDDRTKYWLAVSQLKQNKISESRRTLTLLANDKGRSFYSILAKNRLEKMPPEIKQNISANSKVKIDPQNVSGPENQNPDSLRSPNGDNVENNSVDPSAILPLFSASGETETRNTDIESESEETMTTAVTAEEEEKEEEKEDDKGPSLRAGEGDSTSEPVVNEESDEADNVSSESQISISAFRDPQLRERFFKVHQFVLLGLKDWAKWELYEIERRTRHKPYLYMLMESYLRIQSYNRMAHIAENYFIGERNRGGFNEGRNYWEYNFPKAYKESVEKYAEKFGISPELVWSIMFAESRFFSEALSPVGARGLMQIMPYTADQLSQLLGEEPVDQNQLLNPDTNVKLGSRYLARLAKKFSNQVPLIAASYNAGPHRVYAWINSFGNLDMDEFIEHIPFVETRNYVKKVVRNFVVYNSLYKQRPDSYTWLTEPVPVRVDIRPSPRENWDSID